MLCPLGPRLSAAAVALVFSGCGGTPTPASAPPPAHEGKRPAPSAALEPDTFSPQPALDTPELGRLCAEQDAALSRVAAALAQRVAEGKPPFDAFELERRLREEGAPYVWPHAFTLVSGSDAAVPERLRAWLASFHGPGVRRCGLAQKTHGAATFLAAVAVDVVADLLPIPARVPAGIWLDLEATMLVPFSGAKVVLLGPRGLPRPVLTEVAASRIFARMPLDAPGTWLLQVMSELGGGPRPVLEVAVVAGAGPRALGAQPAPGEVAAADSTDSATELITMVNAARTSEGLPPFAVDLGLSALAGRHAEGMRQLRRTSHDLGEGTPDQRVASAGLEMSDVGENVCRAPDARLAHRALWASPSHRSNILSAHFDCIGIGIARDALGGVWVAELFGRREGGGSFK